MRIYHKQFVSNACNVRYINVMRVLEILKFNKLFLQKVNLSNNYILISKICNYIHEIFISNQSVDIFRLGLLHMTHLDSIPASFLHFSNLHHLHFFLLSSSLEHKIFFLSPHLSLQLQPICIQGFLYKNYTDIIFSLINVIDN